MAMSAATSICSIKPKVNQQGKNM